MKFEIPLKDRKEQTLTVIIDFQNQSIATDMKFEASGLQRKSFSAEKAIAFILANKYKYPYYDWGSLVVTSYKFYYDTLIIEGSVCGYNADGEFTARIGDENYLKQTKKEYQTWFN